MSTGIAGRAYVEQMTHYLRKTFSFDTVGLASAVGGVVWVGTLPANAIVRGTMIKVHTAFNSATSDVLDVGTVSSPQALVAAADITATGGQYAITGMDFAMPADGIDIFIKWTGVSTAPTAGNVTVIVEYFPDNDK